MQGERDRTMVDVIDRAAVFIDMELSNQIRAARKKIQPRENAAPECEGCGEPIPEARRQAMPGYTSWKLCKNSEQY